MVTFFPRLDGLRSFAVVSVMVYHWFHPEVLGRSLPLGFVGVQLFFVLSGFLIGGILIRAQERNVVEGTAQAFTLRQFVIRRALRIFPAYFAFLLITGVVLGVPDSNWWAYPLYLSNFRMADTGSWAGYWAHTWTLAIEEQFYLFAPFVVLFLQRRRLDVVVPCLVFASGFFILLSAPVGAESILPPEAFFGLLVGLMLAQLEEHGRLAPRAMHLGGIFSFVVAVSAFVFDLHDGRLFEVAVPLASAALVWWATGTARAGRFLEWRPFMHIGGLAYGLYLWHMPIRTIWNRLELPELNDALMFAMFFAITYGLARLSWDLIERPINRRKSSFPYHRPVAVRAEREPQSANR